MKRTATEAEREAVLDAVFAPLESEPAGSSAAPCSVDFQIDLVQQRHQSQLHPWENKFHVGNGDDGKHYWLTPPELKADLEAEFGPFDFDPCPYPKPEGFDGLTCEWGQRNYVNPPFGSIIHNGRKKGPTAWMRKAIEEQRKGKLSVVVYPVDKWVLMMLAATGATNVRNLGDVRWHAIEDGSRGKGTGRHIAAFVLYPQNSVLCDTAQQSKERK